MFSECESLYKLPDISKWNKLNLFDINNIFSGCINCINIPENFGQYLIL